jgi:hypothetical protein
MLYGDSCDVFEKSNYLTTFAEMRLFSLLLSTIKWNGSSFTHIYEWKRCSPSSGSSGSSGWIVVVVTVAVGSASIICLLLLLSESELGLNFVSLSLSTNDCFE